MWKCLGLPLLLLLLLLLPVSKEDCNTACQMTRIRPTTARLVLQ
jgi:hypothetical protein